MNKSIKWKAAILLVLTVGLGVAACKIKNDSIVSNAEQKEKSIIDVQSKELYDYKSTNQSANVVIPIITVEDGDTDTINNLKESAQSINKSTKEVADSWIEDFKSGIGEDFYQSMEINYKIVETSPQYFTIRFMCLQTAASGYEKDYYYTIDLSTGKEIILSDLFKADSNYIEVISNNIKEQMIKQMEQDNNKTYWIDNTDTPEWNFKEISNDTMFYINPKNELVIVFNQGDVAPMYMGEVEFVIPNEVIKDIIV